MSDRPRIGVTVGDPAGIGPEIARKAAGGRSQGVVAMQAGRAGAPRVERDQEPGAGGVGQDRVGPDPGEPGGDVRAHDHVVRGSPQEAAEPFQIGVAHGWLVMLMVVA